MTTPQDTTEHKIVGGADMQIQEWKDRYAALAETFNLQRDKIVELQAGIKSEREKLAICVEALEKISYWGVDPTSTAIAAVSEKALDQIKGLKK